jgi:hypothetical protein
VRTRTKIRLSGGSWSSWPSTAEVDATAESTEWSVMASSRSITIDLAPAAARRRTVVARSDRVAGTYRVAPSAWASTDRSLSRSKDSGWAWNRSRRTSSARWSKCRIVLLLGGPTGLANGREL